jgi:fructose-bisphosphate aldolase class II
MKEVVKNKLEEFGAAGNASKIKPSSLSIMASRYQSGELSSITN